MPEQPSSGGLTKRVIINGIYYLYAEYNAAGEQSLDEAADRLEWALLDVQEGYVNDPNWYETRPLLLLPDGSQTAPISILDIPAERGGGVYALRLEFGIQIDVPRKK